MEVCMKKVNPGGRCKMKRNATATTTITAMTRKEGSLASATMMSAMGEKEI